MLSLRPPSWKSSVRLLGAAGLLVLLAAPPALGHAALGGTPVSSIQPSDDGNGATASSALPVPASDPMQALRPTLVPFETANEVLAVTGTRWTPVYQSAAATPIAMECPPATDGTTVNDGANTF